MASPRAGRAYSYYAACCWRAVGLVTLAGTGDRFSTTGNVFPPASSCNVTNEDLT